MRKLYKIKATILNFLLFSLVQYSFAQHSYTDSLQILLSTHAQNDTIKVNWLNELARSYLFSKTTLADSLIKKSLELSDALGYDKGKAMALTIKGALSYSRSDNVSAHKTYRTARTIFEKINDKKGLAYLSRMEANVYMDEGSYFESLQLLLSGLKIANTSGDIKQAVDIERTIGYLYNMIDEPGKAIPYQDSALKHAISILYKKGLAGVYNTIGKTYKTLKDFPSSLAAYRNSLTIDQEANDSLNMYTDISNIGDVYERMGNYKDAFASFRKSLNLYYSKAAAGLSVVAWNEWMLARAHLHSGNADSALFYGKHSLLLSNRAEWRLYLAEITQLIAEAAARLKMYDTAYSYQLLSSHYKDSLSGLAMARKITMLQDQVELDKKQSQISLLTKNQQLKIAESKRQHLFFYLLLGGLTFVIILSILLLRNNRTKQRANILLQKQKNEIDAQKRNAESTLNELQSMQSQLLLKEKEKMQAIYHKELLNLEAKALRSQMNPHFIYNCMNSIKALIQNDDKPRSIEYLTTFSKLIRTLFHNSDKRQVSLFDEIETCKLYTQLESMRLNGKLNYRFSIDPNLDLKSVMVPALIIQPFIENAIWHGIVPKDTGIITVTVNGDNDKVVCEVDDDGIGRERSKLNKPITPVIHESKGVHLSQQRLDLEKMINDHDASITIVDKYTDDISVGTKVILSFNLN